MDTTRPVTRSPVALARKAVEVAARKLPAYSARCSRRDFTQHQLFALMVLGTFLKLDHRALVAVVKDWSDVREAIGLTKVPHHTTLYKAQQRLLKKVCSTPCSTASLMTRPGADWSGPRKRSASTRPAWRRAIGRPITPTGPGKNATACVAGRS